MLSSDFGVLTWRDMTNLPSVLDSAPTTMPAVIVGAEADGLGIARSLGRAGVPVTIVDDDPRQPGMHSRYVRPFVVSALSGRALIDGLLALRQRLNESPILFLTTDRDVRTISEHRERLAGAFHIRLPEHHCVCRLLDKHGFQQLAERHGFPVPRAISVYDERDFVKFSEIRFPAVIKPGNKELFFSGNAPRAQRVRSRVQAEAVCRSILPKAPDLIIQEWIPGSDSDIYFCFQYRGEDGCTVSSFTGRKLRCWPPRTGSTASCTAAPEAEAELEPLTKAFFDKTQFVGMCSMEFKRDPRTGKFFMIEPTVGRADWQQEVATINGVNLPLAVYRYEFGLPLPPAERPRHPLVWSYPPSYWRSVLATKSFDDWRPAAEVKGPCCTFDDPAPLPFFVLDWIRKFWSTAKWREFIACCLRQISGAASAVVEGISRKGCV
jgi:D-aspartate ligase